MSNYDNPIHITYTFTGVDLTGAAADDGEFVGPAGLVGRVVAMMSVVTTGVTVAASTVDVGTGSAADPDLYASHAVPISVDGAVANAFTDNSSDSNLIPADTIFMIGNGGGSTAGIVDAQVTIAWF